MYNQSPIPEYKGNPLIEALPILIDDVSILKWLRSKQSCLDTERSQPCFIRKKYLNRIENFIEPYGAYIESFRLIENLILQSYTSKNPFSATTQHWLHFTDPSKSVYKPSTGIFRNTANSATIIGASGAGKSLMIDRILSYYPQVIRHTNYENKSLNLDQIVWIKVNCTENLNVKALLLLILSELDRLTGSDDAKTAAAAKDPVACARLAIASKFKSSFVGLLVIDEIQNISMANKTLKDLFMQFILNLIDMTGVPILFCGNPEILEVFTGSLKLARRTEGEGLIRVDGLNELEWEIFIEQLWRYQWTCPPTPLNQEHVDVLYGLSTGLPEFAVKIFRRAQLMVMGSKNETISCALLREAYVKQCSLSHEALEQRRNRNGTHKKAVRDAYVPELSNGEIDFTKNPKIAKKSNLVADLSRVQHPEFEDRLDNLSKRDFLPPGNIDMNILRRFNEWKNPLEFFAEKNILLDSTQFL